MARCPICKEFSVKAYRPFCSKRCADVDLAHWLRGDYVIPGETAHPDKPDDKE
ncbi:MAG: DNA gyrase inhibitor YacG [Paracoccus sp. (in: a-proteobacteria)]